MSTTKKATTTKAAAKTAPAKKAPARKPAAKKATAKTAAPKTSTEPKAAATKKASPKTGKAHKLQPVRELHAIYPGLMPHPTSIAMKAYTAAVFHQFQMDNSKRLGVTYAALKFAWGTSAISYHTRMQTIETYEVSTTAGQTKMVRLTPHGLHFFAQRKVDTAMRDSYVELIKSGKIAKDLPGKSASLTTKDIHAEKLAIR